MLNELVPAGQEATWGRSAAQGRAPNSEKSDHLTPKNSPTAGRECQYFSAHVFDVKICPLTSSPQPTLLAPPKGTRARARARPGTTGSQPSCMPPRSGPFSLSRVPDRPRHRTTVPDISAVSSSVQYGHGSPFHTPETARAAPDQTTPAETMWTVECSPCVGASTADDSGRC